MPPLQIIPHRAPPAATRNKLRWQPYASLPISTPTLNTPSSPPQQSHLSDGARHAQCAPPQPPPLVSIVQSRDNASGNNKKQYALGLVDQAVKVLGAIWQPCDIPDIYSTTESSSPNPLCSELGVAYTHEPTAAHAPTSQQASTRVTPSNTPASSCSESFSSHAEFGDTRRKSLVPVKAFVQEVLKRSKSTGSVLQTALCYLEAIRPQINEICRLEKIGQGIRGEPESADRIVPGNPADFQVEAGLGMETSIDNTPQPGVLVPTIIMDDVHDKGSAATIQACPTKTTVDMPALPPLPSPLLCPRRAFLASLILASKFMQDKCYSNRAWAKLCGLPPREVSRCERALGDALGWRLWVGKSAAEAAAAAAQASPRGLSRCRSEANLAPPGPPVTATSSRPLRRAATVPTHVFAPPGPPSEPTVVSTTVFADCLAVMQPDLVPDSTPPTPVLSYSPSSTDSSSSCCSAGDRTIQMSAFVDHAEGTSFGMDWSDTMTWVNGVGQQPTSVGPGGYLVNANGEVVQSAKFLTDSMPVTVNVVGEPLAVDHPRRMGMEPFIPVQWDREHEMLSEYGLA